MKGRAEEKGEITRLLLEWRQGKPEVQELLLSMVYQRLQEIARAYLRKERTGHTLDSSSLVHEAYLKLVDQNRVQWKDRSHFFAIASNIMRRILVDHAREVKATKRGGQEIRVSLEDASPIAALERPPDLLALDEALTTLARSHPEGAHLVELRYFGGLTKNELAEVLEVSEATIARRWRVVRAWLYPYLTKKECHEL